MDRSRGIAQEALKVGVPSGLPARIVRLLLDGDVERKYADEGALLAALATAFINKGKACDDLLGALFDRRTAAGRSVRELADCDGVDAASTALAEVWQRQSEWMEARRRERQETLAQLGAAMNGESWRSVGGASACKLLAWVIQLAAVAADSKNGLVLSFSQRQAAEGCGLGRNAVARAVHALLDRGWLSVLDVGRGPKATTFVLHLPNDLRPTAVDRTSFEPVGAEPTGDSECNHEPDGTSSSGSECHCSESTIPTNTSNSGGIDTGIDLGHDLWRWQGAGPNAGRVYRHVRLNGPCKAVDVQRALGLGKNTLTGRRGLLARMAGWGLVRRAADRRWVAVEADLDAVAESLGVLGCGDRQREAHAAERAMYARLRVDPDTGEIREDAFVRGARRPPRVAIAD